MNEQVLTEYVKMLLDQRANLEVTVLQLQAKIRELETPKDETVVQS